jgi:translation elongation factor EF-1beta
MVLIFSQIKGKLIGDPDRSLSEAYQIAITINSLENDYANQVSTHSKGSRTDYSSYILEEIESNIAILQHKISEFHGANVNSDRLSYYYAEKLIFIEGILAKYKLNNRAFSSNAIDVRSTPMRSTIFPQIPMRNFTPSPAAERENEPTFSGKPKILPRSIGRTVDKLKKDFTPQAEKQVLRDFRRSRSKTFIAAKVLVMLIVIPLLAHLLSKTLIVMPIVEHTRAESESEIFLHAEMKEEALKEIQIFEDELKLETMFHHAPPMSPEVKEEKIKEKVAEIEEEYRHKSNSAISNVFADIFGLIAFALVVFFQRKEIQTLKSFIDNIVYGLSDGAKAFAIILLTDIFVGFHSPHGWEVLLETLASHLGIPANKSAISLFIATVPVILDTIFKYWIFRSLSRMSPSTVATLKDMNE